MKLSSLVAAVAVQTKGVYGVGKRFVSQVADDMAAIEERRDMDAKQAARDKAQFEKFQDHVRRQEAKEQ